MEGLFQRRTHEWNKKRVPQKTIDNTGNFPLAVRMKQEAQCLIEAKVKYSLKMTARNYGHIKIRSDVTLNEYLKSQFLHWREKSPDFQFVFQFQPTKFCLKFKLKHTLFEIIRLTWSRSTFKHGRDQNTHFEKYYYNKALMWGDFVHTN